jgi:solute:Na+ symporter, SSS family
MFLGHFHVLDLAVIAAYLGFVIFLGHRGAKKSGGTDGFFLAGRSLGKIYQFFLNFGNATDANGAVSTASLVYRQGASGVWLGFQLVFLNPYYWFMNAWFRRVRLVTMADLFTDRLGSRGLASFYALFQVAIIVFVVIGFGNLVTYKISSALIVKPESAWTAAERASVEGYRELVHLNRPAAPRDAATEARLAHLREREARGELRSYVTALPEVPFYLVYTLVVGFYVILGGLAATALNEVLQSIIIVLFSIILIPAGFAALGGAEQLAVRLPDEMFALIGSGGAAQQVTGLALLAILLVAVVQINGIVGNMGVAGSARNEYAARFGAVAGTYGKRLMFILWAFTGLIAAALFQGERSLSDPDLAWGLMSRELLGPGLLGLMLTGVLAANMSTISAQAVAASALCVRNLLQPLRPGLTETGALFAGRCAIFVLLAVGVFAATLLDNVFSALVLVQTVNVPVGAAVLLMFFWRRLTVPAVWTALIVSTALNIAGPYALAQVGSLRSHPVLTTRVEEAGRLSPVYFESVARLDPADPASPLRGSGRLHLELVVLKLAGLEPASMTAGHRFAARFFVDALTPFLFLILVSLVTRPPERARVDRFFGKMKTPVGATPELEAAAMAETAREPGRFNRTKLFGPDSSWEFAKWDRTDAVGFLVCCAISGAIILVFWLLLRWAAGGA